jgi:hypothetical protein
LNPVIVSSSILLKVDGTCCSRKDRVTLNFG